jgi:hypothetical protein
VRKFSELATLGEFADYFRPDDGGNTFLRNICCNKSHTSSHPEDGILQFCYRLNDHTSFRTTETCTERVLSPHFLQNFPSSCRKTRTNLMPVVALYSRFLLSGFPGSSSAVAFNTAKRRKRHSVVHYRDNERRKVITIGWILDFLHRPGFYIPENRTFRKMEQNPLDPPPPNDILRGVFTCRPNTKTEIPGMKS